MPLSIPTRPHPGFLVLKHAVTTVGAYPQHQEMEEPYDYDAVDSVHNLSWEDFPAFAPNFHTAILEGRAKRTDLISSAPLPNCGLLLSGRFRAVLEQHHLPRHRYYGVPMKHKGKLIEDIWWLQLPSPENALELVDYARSRFVIHASGGKEEPASIGSADEFRTLNRAVRAEGVGKILVAKSYCLADSFLTGCDLFCMREIDLDSHVYVSKRLRDALVKAGITGVEFGTAKKLKIAEAE